MDNERYDDYNRWTGGINFGGKARTRHSQHCHCHHLLVLQAVCTDLLCKFLLMKDHRALGMPKGPPTVCSADGLWIFIRRVLVKMLCRCRQSFDRHPHGGTGAESDIFMVQIFPKMKNYTPYNRATSVGNQLLNNYRKFLLNYEICHRSRDLGGPLATPSAVTEVGEASTPAHATARLYICPWQGPQMAVLF